MKAQRRYGWRPDVPDHRDFVFKLAKPGLKLPKVVDLVPNCPKTIFDQGQENSCVANAISKAYMFDAIRQGHPVWIPSRNFLYYNGRVLENCVNEDGGLYIRDGMKVLNNQGICPEYDWTYGDTTLFAKPSDACYQTALTHKSIAYQRLRNTDLMALKACLAGGFPFVFGISCYESFESPEVESTGLVPYPGKQENLLGGHCMICVGYNDITNRFKFCNSYGANWGQGGYGTLDYSYLTNGNLSDDFWTLQVIF